MEWITQLQGQVVGLDSAPLIYFIEENPTYLEMTDAFFEAMVKGEFRVVTSVVTLLEVLVHPLRQGNRMLAQQYRDILLEEEGLTTIEVSVAIAQEAAQLRADYNLRTPDAIQMATAIRQGASFFLTNDARLPSLGELEVLVLDELRP
ncbi:MAG: type II toxin-antitoxin system VapC family toxin [Symploca sp. SIO2C1]|nr:type II toxin-antitoxin system VapC family toxin [Symploca sp. SIO2C1]